MMLGTIGLHHHLDPGHFMIQGTISKVVGCTRSSLESIIVFPFLSGLG